MNTSNDSRLRELLAAAGMGGGLTMMGGNNNSSTMMMLNNNNTNPNNANGPFISNANSGNAAAGHYATHPNINHRNSISQSSTGADDGIGSASGGTHGHSLEPTPMRGGGAFAHHHAGGGGGGLFIANGPLGHSSAGDATSASSTSTNPMHTNNTNSNGAVSNNTNTAAALHHQQQLMTAANGAAAATAATLSDHGGIVVTTEGGAQVIISPKQLEAIRQQAAMRAIPMGGGGLTLDNNANSNTNNATSVSTGNNTNTSSSSALSSGAAAGSVASFHPSSMPLPVNGASAAAPHMAAASSNNAAGGGGGSSSSQQHHQPVVMMPSNDAFTTGANSNNNSMPAVTSTTSMFGGLTAPALRPTATAFHPHANGGGAAEGGAGGATATHPHFMDPLASLAMMGGVGGTAMMMDGANMSANGGVGGGAPAFMYGGGPAITPNGMMMMQQQQRSAGGGGGVLMSTNANTNVLMQGYATMVPSNGGGGGNNNMFHHSQMAVVHQMDGNADTTSSFANNYSNDGTNGLGVSGFGAMSTMGVGGGGFGGGAGASVNAAASPSLDASTNGGMGPATPTAWSANGMSPMTNQASPQEGGGGGANSNFTAAALASMGGVQQQLRLQQATTNNNGGAAVEDDSIAAVGGMGSQTASSSQFLVTASSPATGGAGMVPHYSPSSPFGHLVPATGGGAQMMGAYGAAGGMGAPMGSGGMGIPQYSNGMMMGGGETTIFVNQMGHPQQQQQQTPPMYGGAAMGYMMAAGGGGVLGAQPMMMGARTTSNGPNANAANGGGAVANGANNGAAARVASPAPAPTKNAVVPTETPTDPELVGNGVDAATFEAPDCMTPLAPSPPPGAGRARVVLLDDNGKLHEVIVCSTDTPSRHPAKVRTGGSRFMFNPYRTAQTLNEEMARRNAAAGTAESSTTTANRSDLTMPPMEAPRDDNTNSTASPMHVADAFGSPAVTSASPSPSGAAAAVVAPAVAKLTADDDDDDVVAAADALAGPNSEDEGDDANPLGMANGAMALMDSSAAATLGSASLFQQNSGMVMTPGNSTHAQNGFSYISNAAAVGGFSATLGSGPVLSPADEINAASPNANLDGTGKPNATPAAEGYDEMDEDGAGGQNALNAAALANGITEEIRELTKGKITYAAVRFKYTHGVYFIDEKIRADIAVGDMVVVEGDRGTNIGMVMEDATADIELEIKAIEERARKMRAELGIPEGAFVHPSAAAPTASSSTPDEAAEASTTMYATNNEESTTSSKNSKKSGKSKKGSKAAAKVEKEPNPFGIPTVPKFLRVLHNSSNKDRKKFYQARRREGGAASIVQRIVEDLGLPIHVCDAEFQCDFQKLFVFYRVKHNEASNVTLDLRELQKDLYRQYRCRIWLLNWYSELSVHYPQALFGAAHGRQSIVNGMLEPPVVTAALRVPPPMGSNSNANAHNGNGNLNGAGVDGANVGGVIPKGPNALPTNTNQALRQAVNSGNHKSIARKGLFKTLTKPMNPFNPLTAPTPNGHMYPNALVPSPFGSQMGIPAGLAHGGSSFGVGSPGGMATGSHGFASTIGTPYGGPPTGGSGGFMSGPPSSMRVNTFPSPNPYGGHPAGGMGTNGATPMMGGGGGGMAPHPSQQSNAFNSFLAANGYQGPTTHANNNAYYHPNQQQQQYGGGNGMPFGGGYAQQQMPQQQQQQHGYGGRGGGMQPMAPTPLGRDGTPIGYYHQ